MGMSCPKFLGAKSCRFRFVNVTGMSSFARIPVSKTSSKPTVESESLTVGAFGSCAKSTDAFKNKKKLNRIDFIRIYLFE